jgi:hypothetical protein
MNRSPLVLEQYLATDAGRPPAAPAGGPLGADGPHSKTVYLVGRILFESRYPEFARLGVEERAQFYGIHRSTVNHSDRIRKAADAYAEELVATYHSFRKQHFGLR